MQTNVFFKKVRHAGEWIRNLIPFFIPSHIASKYHKPNTRYDPEVEGPAEIEAEELARELAII